MILLPKNGFLDMLIGYFLARKLCQCLSQCEHRVIRKNGSFTQSRFHDRSMLWAFKFQFWLSDHPHLHYFLLNCRTILQFLYMGLPPSYFLVATTLIKGVPSFRRHFLLHNRTITFKVDNLQHLCI